MIIHVLVEGPSDKVLIDGWAPRAFKGHQFKVHIHQGKGELRKLPEAMNGPKRGRGLLDLLPATLKGLASSRDQAVLVLLDADTDDCIRLKKALVEVHQDVAPELPVVFRIAVEETEAYYLGDLAGLKKAFPNADLELARGYVPDSICGTAEVVARVLGEDTLRKVDWAEAIAPYLTTSPARSRSPSFKALIAGIHKLVSPPRAKDSAKTKKKHWTQRHQKNARDAGRRKK
jgi:Domain of unknown function (DUF4276)